MTQSAFIHPHWCEASEYPTSRVQGLHKSHIPVFAFVTPSATFDQGFHTSSQVWEMMYQCQIIFIYEVADVDVYIVSVHYMDIVQNNL